MCAASSPVAGRHGLAVLDAEEVILLALIPTAIVVLFWSQMAREYETSPEPTDAATHRRHRLMAVLISGIGLPITLILTTGIFVIFPRLAFNATFSNLHGRRMGC